MSSIFCDIHCLNCYSPGQHYVNFCKYHRLCQKCVGSLPINTYTICIHCQSSVVIISDYIKLMPLEDSTIDETQSGMVDSISLTKIILEEGISITHKEEEKSLAKLSKDLSLKFTKNKYDKIDPDLMRTLCDHCRHASPQLFTVFCSHLACELCIYNDTIVRRIGYYQRLCNCPIPRPHVEESGIQICLICKLKFKSPAEKNVCSMCRSQQNLMYSNEFNRICKICFDKACFFCQEYTGDKYKKTECSLCTECYSDKKKKKHNEKNVCKFCFEYRFSSYNLNCGHPCCEFCSPTVESCLQCIISNEKVLSIEQECCICTEIKKAIKLICGHFVCQDCKDFKILKRLNYCCVICCLKKQKRCIKCKKLARWTENNRFFKKKCCKNKYCKFCLKKHGFIYKSCECGKYKKNN